MSGNINQQDYWLQNARYQQQQYQQQPPIQHDQQPQQQHSSLNFEMPVQDFSQDLSFQSFEITSGDANNAADGSSGYASQNVYGNNPYLNPGTGVYSLESTYAPTFPTESRTTQKFISSGSMPGGDGFEDEAPLLEELGINPEHILQKTLTVLNPFRTPETSAVQDPDFAGPIAFCLAFGGFLLLSGKVHFSYIYGIGVFGCLSMWALLTLMSTAEVSLATVVTVLGYCILPMVALSGVNIILSLQGYIGIVLTSVAIMWCSLSASKLFVTALSMDRQQPLVVYPCALLYGVFALITIF